MQIQPTNAQAKEINRSSSSEPSQNKLSAYEQGKKMQDVAILSATYKNSSADNPMKLLYKTAIEEINQQLQPTLGENAIQNAYDNEVDVSPEATAERIVSGSTAFYQAFKEQNPDLTEEESLDEFINVISSGIDKGFDEAKGILESLKVLEGDIETNIDATYDLVQDGLMTFKDEFLKSLAEQLESDNDVSDIAE